MKKLLSLILSVCLLAGASGCSQSKTETEAADTAVEDQNALVVYFSWSGNTKAVAEEIASQTSGDLVEIQPQEPYTDDYNTLLDIAQEEQNANARPALAHEIENIDAYDVIYLGYPIWWSDMPMLMYTVLDTYDFSDKIIAPFCTSGGSGLSGTVASIQEMEPDAVVREGLSVSDGDAQDCASEVSEWLNSITE